MKNHREKWGKIMANKGYLIKFSVELGMLWTKLKWN